MQFPRLFVVFVSHSKHIAVHLAIKYTHVTQLCLTVCNFPRLVVVFVSHSKHIAVHLAIKYTHVTQLLTVYNFPD